MYDNKWRIQIGDEVWEFDTFDQFKETLIEILLIKQTYGQWKINTHT